MSSKRILLVDDQPLVLSAIAHYLARNGYEIETAVNGVEALELAQASRPDLIITDVMMPVMDGWTLVRSLRSMPQFALLPVIILTDQDSPESRMQGFRLGADDFVSKTTLVEELEIRMARALERAAAIATAMGQSSPPAAAAAPPPPPKSVSPKLSPASLDLPPLAQALQGKGQASPPPIAPSPAPETPAPSPTPARVAGGLQGSLDEIGLASVLTLLCGGGQTGVLNLVVRGQSEKGQVLIREGAIVKIYVDGMSGADSAKSISAIMQWKQATFSFVPQDVTSRDEVQSSCEHLLMEASQHLDEQV